MKTFVLSLLVCSLSMTVIALLFRLVCRALGNRYAARWRYAAWLVVLAGFLLPIRPAWPSSPVSLPSAPAGGTAAALAVSSAPGFDPYPVLFLVWLLGGGLMLACLLVRHVSFCRTAARFSRPLEREDARVAREVLAAGGKPSLPVRRCRCVPGPLAVGLFRPCILLPDRPYPPEELSLVLQHELVHCRRKDLLFQTLLAFCRCLHWFNPLLPLIQRMMERDCELACDEMVLRSASPDTRDRYCHLLLDTAAQEMERATVLSTGFGGGKASLKQRLSSALDGGKRRRFLAVAAILLTLTVGCGMFFPARAEKTGPEAADGTAEWTATTTVIYTTATAYEGFPFAASRTTSSPVEPPAGDVPEGDLPR